MLKYFIHTLYLYILRLMHCDNIPIGGILMLHRVDILDKTGIWYNQHLKVSPSTIEEMADYAKRHNCHFVSLEEMEKAIRKKKNVRRWIAVTLDDGYQDNYLNGAPVFRKCGIPFTIYVCTKMVNKEMLYWWEILEQLVLENDRIELSDGRVYDCSTKEAKEKSFLDIREIILTLPQNDLVNHLRLLFSNYDLDYNYGNDKLGLSWKEITELAKEPLCTIGNHTYSHSAFIGQTDTEIEQDICCAGNEMKEHVGIDMQHFAFPFGEASAVSQHDIQLVKGLGFKTSATTKDGFVCYGTDPLELPRIFVTEKNWKQVIDRIIANC